MIAELSAPRSFRLREQSIEPPVPGHVQVRVEAVGVCGSDLHYFAEGHVGDASAVYPMVLGHEPVGTIIALGQGVSGWSTGDRVALEAPIYCYHCEFCMCGRHNLCENVRFMSSPGEPGFFRDRANLPAKNLLPLPKNLGFAEATLHEPLAIILHSFSYAKPQIGETAVVFGAGPIGLMTISALRLSGISRLWAVDPVAHRREMAVALGASVAIDPGQVDPVAEILKDTAGRGADVVFDCAAKDNTINQAIRVTRSAGRVMITGVPSELQTPIDFHILRRKEIAFRATRRYNDTAGTALTMLSQHLDRFAPMVTHRKLLPEIQSSFETLEAYADGVGKIVIYP